MRLIDADALMEQVSRKKAEPATIRHTEGFNDALDRVRSMIHSAPTIQPEYPPPDDRVTIKLAEGAAAIVRKINGQYIVDLVRLQPDIPPDEAERYNA